MPNKCLYIFASDTIPQTDGFVSTCTGKRLSIRAERDALNVRSVSSEGSQMCSRTAIPQIDAIVSSSGTNKYCPVGTEYNAIDTISVFCECLRVFTCSSIPQVDFTKTCTHEYRVNGVEGYTRNRRSMSFECFLVLTRGDIPQAYCFVRTRTCECLSI